MTVDFTVSIVTDEDIPAPHASRAKYRTIIEDVLADGATRELRCRSRSDAKAVYAGIMRAVGKTRTSHDLIVYSRTLEDGSVSVFVERG